MIIVKLETKKIYILSVIAVTVIVFNKVAVLKTISFKSFPGYFINDVFQTRLYCVSQTLV